MAVIPVNDESLNTGRKNMLKIMNDLPDSVLGISAVSNINRF
jgi:hypothetical protein